MYNKNYTGNILLAGNKPEQSLMNLDRNDNNFSSNVQKQKKII